ncbi:MAG TPA: hypothetical protein VF472_07300 [Burkholderiaceae bacterium]
MTSPLDSLRDLAARNAGLRQHANRVQQNLDAAAEKEGSRLSALIGGVSQADVLMREEQAETYQSWVMQRAGLQRLLAQTGESADPYNQPSRS